MTLPLFVASLRSSTCGFMITPPLAMPAGDERHLQRRGRDVLLTDRREGEARFVAVELAGSGKCDAAAAGRSSGGCSPKPNALASAARLAPPRSRPIWAKPVLQLTRSRSAMMPPHELPPKLGRSLSVRGRSSCAQARVVLGRQFGRVIERGRRGDDLERGARRVRLAVAARQQRLRGSVCSAFHAARTSSCLCAASGVGSKLGKLTMARIAPVVGSSATTAPRRLPSASRRDALHRGVDGERDVADALAVVEQVAQAVVAVRQRAADEVVVEGALGAVGAEGEGQVAGDGREQRALGVLALPLELVAARDRAREHHAVGGLDQRRGRR